MGEETTKYAKPAKMGTQIISKEESYKIIGAPFEVYKEKAERISGGCKPIGRRTPSPGYQLLESHGQAIGAIGELRTLSEDRTRTVRKPIAFALLACFVVEREDGYLSYKIPKLTS